MSIKSRLTALERARPEGAKPFKAVWPDGGGKLYDRPFWDPARRELAEAELEGFEICRVAFVRNWRPPEARPQQDVANV